MLNLSNCTEWIRSKHEGQKRIQGTPYYLHPVAVAKILKEKGFSEEYQIAGLCHDLLEDTNTTYQELLHYTNQQIAQTVKLVTKEKGYQEAEYFQRIQEHEMAHMVKLADRLHNLKESVFGNEAFQKKYLLESKKWYIPMAKGTVFEEDIRLGICQLEQNYRQLQEEER